MQFLFEQQTNHPLVFLCSMRVSLDFSVYDLSFVWNCCSAHAHEMTSLGAMKTRSSHMAGCWMTFLPKWLLDFSRKTCLDCSSHWEDFLVFHLAAIDFCFSSLNCLLSSITFFMFLVTRVACKRCHCVTLSCPSHTKPQNSYLLTKQRKTILWSDFTLEYPPWRCFLVFLTFLNLLLRKWSTG